MSRTSVARVGYFSGESRPRWPTDWEQHISGELPDGGHGLRNRRTHATEVPDTRHETGRHATAFSVALDEWLR